MIDSSDRPNEISCSEAAQLYEKLILEEPLSDSEQTALHNHNDQCEECREISTVTNGLSRYGDSLEDNALKTMVSNVKLEYFSHRNNKFRRKITFAVIAAVAASFIYVMFLPSLYDKPSKSTVSTKCSPSEPAVIANGVLMSYCDSIAPHVEIENNGNVKISINKGAIGVFVDSQRLKKNRIAVNTPFGEVRVTGTLFTVNVEAEDTRVEVFNGTVEIIPSEYANNIFNVSAGHSARMRKNKIYDLAEAETESLRAILDTYKHKALLSQKTEAQNEFENPRETEETEDTEEKLEKPTKNANEIETGPARIGLSLDDLLREAHACLIDHRWQCAASRYRQVLNRYASQPEAAVALIALAKLELRHLNAPKKALEYYQSYQRKAPKGPLAEEALFGTAEAYRQLGNTDKEAETLRRCIKRYPNSLKAKEAMIRLKQLDAMKQR